MCEIVLFQANRETVKKMKATTILIINYYSIEVSPLLLIRENEKYLNDEFRLK